MRPKDIGTRYETSCVRWLRANGFPHAERRALAGINDLGDITGTPGIAWECKSGDAAHNASDGQVAKWLDETERERIAAKADLGVLLLDRSGYGEKRCGETWAIIRAINWPLGNLDTLSVIGHRPIRMHLTSMLLILRTLGYGDELTAHDARLSP
jgi:hypothetical protein